VLWRTGNGVGKGFASLTPGQYKGQSHSTADELPNDPLMERRQLLSDLQESLSASTFALEMRNFKYNQAGNVERLVDEEGI